MDEKKFDNAMSGLSNEGMNVLDELFKDTENPSGLELLGALFALNDNDFELLRPVMQDAMIEAYNSPQAQMQLVQALASAGISIDDVLNHSDEVIEQLFNSDEIELSESKKDFFKFMFVAVSNAISSSTINPAHVVEIPVEICRENAKLPTYATNGSGAMDIYSSEEVTLQPGECKIVPIGIKVAIPHGYGLLIQPRSGLSRKIKLRIPNTPGLIDEDYHEEIGVIVENTNIRVKDVDIYEPSDHIELVKEYGSLITIGAGERFAQMRLVEIPRIKWKEVNSLGTFSADEDHGKGFGHSGQF